MRNAAGKTNGHVPALSEAESKTTGPTPGSPNVDLIGPAIGPVLPASIPSPDEPIYDIDEATPLSPYSASRSMIRQLTLPSVPNLDIPPSPPGSPVASTNAKFAHFLELKKKGVHFNAKLANSAASKNPSLMQKLMEFAGLDENDQYASTLPKEMWNPDGFPKSAYRQELAKSQKQILKRREEEKSGGKRNAVDFVPATVSGESSRGGTPSQSRGRMEPKSTSERILAGLDNSKGSLPQVAGTKRKTRFES